MTTMNKLSALLAVLFASASLAVLAEGPAKSTEKSADVAKPTATAEPMKSDAAAKDTTKKKSAKKKSGKKSTKTAKNTVKPAAEKPAADKAMDSKEAPKK
jgi:hypothetical protein